MKTSVDGKRQVSRAHGVRGGMAFVLGLALCVQLFGTSIAAAIDHAFLVSDLNKRPSGSFYAFKGPNDTLLFRNADYTHGQELWISDGTSTGTRLLKDINPGADHSFPWGGAEFKGLTYFTATDNAHGAEPWVTDGTTEGTRLFVDIVPGESSSQPAWFTVVGDFVVFSAQDPSHGKELWSTDGTPEGTHLIADINPGLKSSRPGPFRSDNGICYFAADDGVHGRELWRTDGTSSGTVLVRDIRPGSYGSNPSLSLLSLAGRVVFVADDGPHGAEPWITDGTTSGTTLIKDICPGSEGSDPRFLGSFGTSRLVFAANDGVTGSEPWITDGTEQGTFLLHDTYPGPLDGFQTITYPPQVAVLNSEIYLLSTSGVWKSDGTSSGTVPMFPNVVADGTSVRNTQILMRSGSLLYLAVQTKETGAELWRSDGTAEGTVLVKDIVPGPGSSSPNNFFAADGELYFSAGPISGPRGLWKSDGTESGTILLRDSLSFPTLQSIQYMFNLGHTLVFYSNNGMWKTDGTPEGTEPLAGLLLGTDSSNPAALTAFGSRVIFVHYEGYGYYFPWISDGTEKGTRRMCNVEVDYNPPYVTVGDRVFVAGSDGYQRGVWVSDGTPDGLETSSGLCTCRREEATLPPSFVSRTQLTLTPLTMMGTEPSGKVMEPKRARFLSSVTMKTRWSMGRTFSPETLLFILQPGRPSPVLSFGRQTARVAAPCL